MADSPPDMNEVADFDVKKLKKVETKVKDNLPTKEDVAQEKAENTAAPKK